MQRTLWPRFTLPALSRDITRQDVWCLGPTTKLYPALLRSTTPFQCLSWPPCPHFHLVLYALSIISSFPVSGRYLSYTHCSYSGQSILRADKLVNNRENKVKRDKKELSPVHFLFS